MNSGVNITVSPELDITIINEFSDVKVSEILFFLCQEYNLEIINIGSIISLKGKRPEVKKEIVRKELNITYNEKEKLLSYDLRRDSLYLVVKKITSLTVENILISPTLNDKLVSGFIVETNIDKALESLAFSNNLELDTTDNGFYSIIEKIHETKPNIRKTQNINLNKKEVNKDSSSFSWSIHQNKNISIQTKKGDLKEIIETISDSLNVCYSFISPISDKQTINFQDISYDDFLEMMLNNTEYTHFKKNGIYFIGKGAKELFTKTEVVYLNYRRSEDLKELIPIDLKSNLEIIETKEYNGIIITGPEDDVIKLKEFVKKIDKTIPVIQIEILIVDVLKTYNISTGIQMGTGKPPKQSSQTLLPGIDYSLSTESINNMVSKINGFGWVNLGKVNADFYLNLQALEQNNVLSINSTPKLATLNGHEAELSSGEIRYYKEERNDYIGSQNPSLASSYTWKPLSADLKIKIKPTVSGNDQITLEIEVTQDEFQNGGAEDAPPGSITRSFKSIISVNDQEMILLGGLDKLSKSESSQGTPFLSRIPIIKWFFSSRTKSKSDSRLNIFIVPTIAN